MISENKQDYDVLGDKIDYDAAEELDIELKDTTVMGFFDLIIPGAKKNTNEIP